MKLLRQIEAEVEAEHAGMAPMEPASPHAAQGQSAELLGQPATAPLSPAEAQAAELNAQPAEAQSQPQLQPDPFELPPFMIELLTSPEADEVLGPLPAEPHPPSPEAVERVRRLLDEPMPGPVEAAPAYEPTLATVYEVTELERDPTVASEANHPVSREPSSRAPSLPTIREVPEVERDPTVASEANHPTARRAPTHQPTLDTIDEHARPEPGKDPLRARIAQETDTLVGPGVAWGAQGPGDAIAHVVGKPHPEVADTPHFGENAAAFATGMGLTGGVASTVGAGARLYNAKRNLRAGRDKVNNAADDSERRSGMAQVRGAVADLGQGSNAAASSATGVSSTIAELAGAAVPAGVGLAGGVMGGVGGAAQLARHGRKGNRARRRYRALHALKGKIADAELQKVRAYAAKKNAKAMALQGFQSMGGGVGAAAGIAVAASAATPVGWALAGTAAAVGLGAAGYTIGRRVYKDHVVKPRREAAGQDPDKRRAMAVKLQQKLGDRDERVRAEAEALVQALGLTVDQALGADGIELLKRKMRTA